MKIIVKLKDMSVINLDEVSSIIINEKYMHIKQKGDLLPIVVDTDKLYSIKLTNQKRKTTK